jgi:uncharacterized integral membrane protein (TIGR00697 family)
MPNREVAKIDGWDKVKKPTVMFLRLAIVYAACLLLANILATKMISIGPLVASGGIIVFPLVYIISDIMTEVYGMRLSMVAIRMNVVVNVLLVLFTFIASKLPWPVWWQGQAAFATVFQYTWRIVLASMIAYYLGDWLNSAVISRMKVKSVNGKNFPLRAFVSTLAGEGIDTLLFCTIAFAGTMSTSSLLIMIATQYVGKCAYEGVCLPITTPVVAWWKRQEGMEVYDTTDSMMQTYRPL